jgi:hypothetical protein
MTAENRGSGLQKCVLLTRNRATEFRMLMTMYSIKQITKRGNLHNDTIVQRKRYRQDVALHDIVKNRMNNKDPNFQGTNQSKQERSRDQHI